MAGKGLQYLPLSRLPEKWDPVWFSGFCREVLALADTRNAIEGSGITITGQSGENATISASDDLQNLLLQPFVLASASGFLGFERILAGESGVVDITDGGANGNITVGLTTNGVNLGKLAQLSGMGILGNPVDAVGAIQNIQAEVNGDVLTRQGTDLIFTNAPVWTGNHGWLDSAEIRLGTGNDLRLFHDGINSTIRNDTGTLIWMSGATVNGYLEAAGVRLIQTAAAVIPFAETPDLIVERSIKIIRASSPNLCGIAYGSTGTLAAPAAVSNGDFLFTFKGRGYDGVAFSNDRGEIRLVANEAWSSVANGTRWDFLTTPNGSVVETGAFRIVGVASVQLLNDNQEFQIGASQDLRVYHDGSNSVIENDTGNLVFKVNGELDLEEVTSSASASAGAGTALPATPQGYMTVIINGTSRKIPYYPT